MHTHVGEDIQQITFDNPGNYNVILGIIGTGVEPPFDTSKSGVVGFTVVVE